MSAVPSLPPVTSSTSQPTLVDCRGMSCPAPILATAKSAKALGNRQGTLVVVADDPAFPLDIKSWCRSTGHDLVDLRVRSDGFHQATVRVGDIALSARCTSRHRCPAPVFASTPRGATRGAEERGETLIVRCPGRQRAPGLPWHVLPPADRDRGSGGQDGRARQSSRSHRGRCGIPDGHRGMEPHRGGRAGRLGRGSTAVPRMLAGAGGCICARACPEAA